MLCRAVKFGQVFPLYLSSFVLTLMAVDRVGITGSISISGTSSRATSSAISVGKVGAWQQCRVYRDGNQRAMAL